MWKGLALGTAALGTGLLLRSEYEKNHFLVEELAIDSPKIQKEHRFIFITDVHDKEFGTGNGRLFKAIRQINPEGIFIGGDVMVSREGTTLTSTFALLEGLVSIAPVYYALGNHESRMETERGNYGDKYEQLLQKAGELGVVMLIDQNLFLGRDLAVAGVRLSQRYYQKLFLKNPLPMPERYLCAKLGRAAKERYQILLMHSPLYFRTCRQWGADLTLAGHFHGGTIRIPGLGGMMTPQYQFFLPWCAGNFQEDGKWMAVGRGLGTHSINIRLNDRPQVLVVHLLPKDGKGE